MVQQEVVCLDKSDEPLFSSGSLFAVLTLEHVTYESKDGLSGVKFVDDSKTKGWTTVRQKSSKRRPASAPNLDSETDSEGSDLNIFYQMLLFDM